MASILALVGLARVDSSTFASVATIVLSFVGSAFAVVRLTLAHHRAMSDRFVTYLEGALQRQEAVNSQFQNAITRLSESVRENSTLLARISERWG